MVVSSTRKRQRTSKTSQPIKKSRVSTRSSCAQLPPPSLENDNTRSGSDERSPGDVPSTSTIYTESQTNDVELLKLEDDQIDQFLAALSEIVRPIRKVSVAKVWASHDILMRKGRRGTRSDKDDGDFDITAYLQPSVDDGIPDLVLFPIQHQDHYTIAVFDINEKSVWYFDSMGTKCVSAYYIICKFMEKSFGGAFTRIPRKQCECTIHVQTDLYNCGIFLLRTAEEICFHGKNRLLEPFDISQERARVKTILELIEMPDWNHIWPQTLQDLHRLQESRINEAIMIGGEETDGSSGTPSPSNNDMTDEEFHEILETVVGNPEEATLDPDTIVIPYLSLSIIRELYYNLQQERKVMSPSSTPLSYRTLIGREMELVFNMLKGFPEFVHLPYADKLQIFKKFYKIFHILDRLFTTVKALKTCGDDIDNAQKKILLPDGRWIHLGTREADSFAKTSEEARVLLAVADTLLPKMKLHVFEAIYCFSFVVWDLKGLQVSETTKEFGKESMHLITSDMFTFYKRDNAKMVQLCDTVQEILNVIQAATDHTLGYLSFSQPSLSLESTGMEKRIIEAQSQATG